jgi:predicted Zn-dependent protease
VLIDGRGSYSIDQQRYNGQFGGHAFWEIRDGRITRMDTDVTYNAITTDFLAALDAVTGRTSGRCTARWAMRRGSRRKRIRCRMGRRGCW